jgi:hypothetical protein
MTDQLATQIAQLSTPDTVKLYLLLLQAKVTLWRTPDNQWFQFDLHSLTPDQQTKVKQFVALCKPDLFRAPPSRTIKLIEASEPISEEVSRQRLLQTLQSSSSVKPLLPPH